jgi:hypothetical protein
MARLGARVVGFSPEDEAKVLVGNAERVLGLSLV